MVRGRTRKNTMLLRASWKAEEIRKIDDDYKEGSALKTKPADPDIFVTPDCDPRSPSEWHISKDPSWIFEAYKSVSSGEEKELDIIGGLPSI